MAEVHRQIQNQLEEMVSVPAWVCQALPWPWVLPVWQPSKTLFRVLSG